MTWFYGFSPARKLDNLERIYVSRLGFGLNFEYMPVVARETCPN
jgi:hypothetical protein